MAELVNLRRARKQKDRAKARQKGAENAAKSGRSKSQKAGERAEVARLSRQLDGHKRPHDDG